MFPKGTKKNMTQHDYENKVTRFAEWLISELMTAKLLEESKTKPSNAEKREIKNAPDRHNGKRANNAK